MDLGNGVRIFEGRRAVLIGDRVYPQAVNSAVDIAESYADDAEQAAGAAQDTLAAIQTALENIDVGTVNLVAETRGVLAALPFEPGRPAILTELRRSGIFVPRAGNFAAMVDADPLQGVYVARASDPSGATGAWVRTGWDLLNVQWFGAIPDEATDVLPAANAAFNLGEALGVVIPYGLGTPGVRFPWGRYYSSGALVPQQTTRLVGDGGKGDAGGPASVIRFAPNCHGIDLQVAFGVRAPSILIEGLCLIGGYTDFASEGEYHGLNARLRFTARNVFISNFQGDGFNIIASSLPENDFLVNANCFVVEDCWADFCRNGMQIAGADVNASCVNRVSTVYNRQWGIWNRAFLGLTIGGPSHADGNGITGEPGSMPATVVSHAGFRFAVRKDWAAWCSVNPPSNVGVDNAGWISTGPGGPFGAGNGINIPLWTSGMALREGGSYRGDSINLGCIWDNNYVEPGQGPAQLDVSEMCLGGQGMPRHGGSIWTDYRGVCVKSLVVEGNIAASGMTYLYGRQSGAASDLDVRFFSTNYYNHVQFETYLGGAYSLDGSILTGRGFGMFLAGWPKVSLRPNGVDVAEAINGAFNILAGKVLQVGGVKVVGAQQPAIANSGDATVNAILGALRAHGLIAT